MYCMLESILNFGEEPKLVVDFMDREYWEEKRLKKDMPNVFYIIKFIISICEIALFIAEIFFQKYLGDTTKVWLCFIVIDIWWLKKGDTEEKREISKQLIFFEDYMVLCYSQGRMIAERIFYKDVTKCLYTKDYKMIISGKIDEMQYDYKKDGTLVKNPSFQNHYDSEISFYTVCDNRHNFVEIIENNSPLTVEYEDL